MAGDAPQIAGYEVGRLIGRGGSAVIYEALDVRHDRPVAIKVIHTGELDESRRRRFVRELRALGRLSDHPNVVTVHDSGFTDDGSPFLVMPLIEGGTYSQLLRKKRRLPVDAVVDLGIVIGSALETAHRRGILHCDIKPSNVLVGPYETPMLADFGISSVVDSGVTTTDRASLTLLYAAPEMLDDAEATVRSDLYSLGATLFALVEGEAAYSADSTGAIVRNVLAATSPPRLSAPGSEAFADVLQAMMAIDPAHRPASAAAVVGQLQDIQRRAGAPVTTALVGDPIVDKTVAADGDGAGADGRAFGGAGGGPDRGGRSAGAGGAGVGGAGVGGGVASRAGSAEHLIRVGRTGVGRRVAALVLLAVAAIAAVVGLVVVGGDDVGRAADQTVESATATAEAAAPAGQQAVDAEADAGAVAAAADAGSGDADEPDPDDADDPDAGEDAGLDAADDLDAGEDAGLGAADDLDAGEDAEEEVRGATATADAGRAAVPTPFPSAPAPRPDPAGTRPEPAERASLLLLAAPPDPVRTLPSGTAHHDTATVVDWSVTDLIATGGTDDTVRIWDSDGTYLADLAQTADIWALAWSPDGSRLAVADDDKLGVWDFRTGRFLAFTNSHRQTALAWSTDGTRLASGSWHRVHLWDADRGVRLFEAGHDLGGTWSIDLAADDIHLVAGTADGPILEWNTTELGEPSVVGRHGGQGYAGTVTFMSGGSLLSGGTDGLIQFWDDDGEPVRTIVDTWHPTAVRLSPDESTVLTAGQVSSARLWDLASGELIVSFNSGERPIGDLVWAPDGEHAAVVSLDSTARIWDLSDAPNLTAITLVARP